MQITASAPGWPVDPFCLRRSDALLTWRPECASRSQRYDRQLSPSLSLHLKELPKGYNLTSPRTIRVDHVSRNSKLHPSQLPTSNFHTPGLGETITDFHIRTTEPTLSQLRLPISNLHHVRDTSPSFLASHALSPNRPLYTGATFSIGPAQLQHRHTPVDNGLRGSIKAWHG